MQWVLGFITLILLLLSAYLVFFWVVVQPLWGISNCFLSREISTGKKLLWIIVLVPTWTVGNLIYGFFGTKGLTFKKATVSHFILGILAIYGFFGLFLVFGTLKNRFPSQFERKFTASAPAVRTPGLFERMADDRHKKFEEKMSEFKARSSAININQLTMALEEYFRDNGYRYPTTAQGLKALLEKPKIKPIPSNWKGPYSFLMPRNLKDEWGRDFIYVCPGKFNTSSFDLYSMGPNGVGSGTDTDDISNFAKQESGSAFSELQNEFQQKKVEDSRAAEHYQTIIDFSLTSIKSSNGTLDQKKKSVNLLRMSGPSSLTAFEDAIRFFEQKRNLTSDESELLKFLKSEKEKIETGLPRESQLNPSLPTQKLADSGFLSNYQGPASVTIPIQAMSELDFKSKREILGARLQRVLEQPPFVSGTYTPRDEIFGQIEDGKPWWGVNGIITYSNGANNIQGVSKESQYINNPYLLVGLGEPGAHKLDFVLEREAEHYYPFPTYLNYEPALRRGHAIYQVSYFTAYLDQIHSHFLPAHPVNLKCYNARDFGFNYVYVDPDQSSNVESQNRTGQAVRIQQMLHCGGSCGYAGGCNNMSPEQKDLNIDIKGVPARAYIKLWQQAPTDVKGKPDFLFILELR